MGALGDLYESYFGNEEVTRLSMARPLQPHAPRFPLRVALARA